MHMYEASLLHFYFLLFVLDEVWLLFCCCFHASFLTCMLAYRFSLFMVLLLFCFLMVTLLLYFLLSLFSGAKKRSLEQTHVFFALFLIFCYFFVLINYYYLSFFFAIPILCFGFLLHHFCVT